MQATDTIIFIHGAWVTPLCWRYFEPLFADWGFRTLTPAWPARRPGGGIPEIVEHYKNIIRKQDKPPILIGHSFGGLIVQLLLDQGWGAAGIAISSVPPRGVAPIRISRKTFKQLRTLFGTPFSWRKMLHPPELDDDLKAFLRAKGIETHLVPESGRIFWQLIGSAARVNFQNGDRPPLLLIACGEDHCVPGAIQQRNFEKYRGAEAHTDFVVFPDLSHFSIAEPGGQALADCCAAWALARLREREAEPVAELTA